MFGACFSAKCSIAGIIIFCAVHRSSREAESPNFFLKIGWWTKTWCPCLYCFSYFSLFCCSTPVDELEETKFEYNYTKNEVMIIDIIITILLVKYQPCIWKRGMQLKKRLVISYIIINYSIIYIGLPDWMNVNNPHMKCPLYLLTS